MFLWVGQLASNVGDKIYYTAAVWFVFQKTYQHPDLQSQAGLRTGILLVVSSLPALFLSAFFGVLVDRLNRKFILAFCDIARAGVLLWVALRAGQGKLTVAELYGATVLIGVSASLFNPCVWAVLPSVASLESLAAANSFVQLLSLGSYLLGPVIAAFLIGSVKAELALSEGVRLALSVGMVGFLVSGVCAVALNLPGRIVALRRFSEIVTDIREAFAFLHSDRLMYAVLKVGCVLNFFVAGYVVVLPCMTTKVYRMGGSEPTAGTVREVSGLRAPANMGHTDPEAVRGYGALQGALALGFIVGSLLVAAIGDFRRKAPVLVWGLAAQAVFIIAIGFVHWFYLGLGLLWAIGLGNALVNVNMLVLFQTRIPDDKRGRIFAFRETITTALFPLSYAAMGFAVDHFPFWVICSMSGLAWLAGAAYLWTLEGLREV